MQVRKLRFPPTLSRRDIILALALFCNSRVPNGTSCPFRKEAQGLMGHRGLEEMVLIPTGTFLMGTDEQEIEGKHRLLGPRVREILKSETPKHEVTVGSFYMDKHEVTHRHFQAFLDENPQWRRDRINPRLHNGDYLKHWEADRFPEGKGEHPVVYVTWFAAVAFAAWAGKRLPTESEWEYAARGGLQEAEYPWGDDPVTPDRANYAGSHLGGTTAVGRYRANRFGLHDMAGNVWEYCLDEWQGTYDPSARQGDDRSIQKLLSSWMNVTTRRVIRGGSWGGAPVNLRVAYRDSHPPGGAAAHVGFRCVRSTSR